MMSRIKNIALYKFFKPDFDLEQVRELFIEHLRELGVKGSILLSPEGINLSLSGESEKVDAFLEFLYATAGLVEPDVKVSYSDKIALQRIRVRIKPHIVPAPGVTELDMTKDFAPKLSPEQFHQWLQEHKEMVILDTRNEFEYQVGHFENSLHLGTKHFSDFENDLQKAPPEWLQRPIVTFCTGGIRCEKAAPLMLKKGFREVYQLEGGILNYFEKVGRGYYRGECFVFDERVALDEELKPSHSL